jgi:hypothetical protein
MSLATKSHMCSKALVLSRLASVVLALDAHEAGHMQHYECKPN